MESLGLRVLWEGQNFARLLGGLWVVVQLSVLSILGSLVLGLGVGLIMTLPYKITRFLTRVYLEFIRIMPSWSYCS
jgi:polar amino acid transport system permease protein